MICAIGTDLVDMRRIEAMINRYGERFLNRIFTVEERRYCDHYRSAPRRVEAYARRFAAKEALSKALGTGISNGLSFLDIEVRRESGGPPLLALSKKGQTLLMERYGDAAVFLSLSDEPPYALAFVVIQKKP